MNEPVPLAQQLWSAADCAAYFQQSADLFLRTTRHQAGFPRQTEASDGGHPRWSAAKVCAWGIK